MLALQVEHWNSYPQKVRQRMRINLIDDGSPDHPALPIAKKYEGDLALWRINEDIPWNQHGARNLGAKMAKGENPWMFMSDLDIVLPADMAVRLLRVLRKLKRNKFFTFERAYAPDFTRRKIHTNTFLVRKQIFWKSGGYDEDYCGTYGGDHEFLQGLRAVAKRGHLGEILLHGYDIDVVSDAHTLKWSREGHYFEEFIRKREQKKTQNDLRPRNLLRFAWVRQL